MAKTPHPDRSDGAGRNAAGRQGTANRREQQRAVQTRKAILDAALNEFAERGFDGASIRRIGALAGVDHTLITYHFRTKDALWKACAVQAFEIIGEALAAIPEVPKITATERLRAEFKAFLRFTVDYGSFHNFMLRETQGASPRLPWLIENILGKMRDRLMLLIRQAQSDGGLFDEDPDLLYYLLIGITAVPSTLSGEMSRTIGYSLDSDEAVERYWKLVERALFR